MIYKLFRAVAQGTVARLTALLLAVVLVPRVAAGESGDWMGSLILVDQVDCGSAADPHPFQEFPAGASRIQTLLGSNCRVLPPDASGARYFAYRMGRGKGLVAGKAYVLRAEYPEDLPRSLYIMNRGGEYSRGFHTGAALGDSLIGWVNSNAESLAVPLSGKYETWESLFYLHDRFAGIQLPRDAGARPDLPQDGFWVLIAQGKEACDPASNGAAISRLSLYEVPNPSSLDTPTSLLPAALPHRHLFFREEMGDGVITSRDATQRGLTDEMDWYRYKMRLMKFLGMNTFAKDLLEFGNNQGFDVAPYGGNSWCYEHSSPKRWENILTMLEGSDFYVLPYYEYAGSIGSSSLGIQKRCKPLFNSGDYTGIWWSEIANADITDPDTYADVKKLMDATLTRYKTKNLKFLGAWFRPRGSSMPISFSDATLLRFANEVNGGAVPGRDQLKNDAALLARYHTWWFAKRRQFLEYVRDYLGTELGQAATVLLTADATEPGRPLLKANQVVTDNAAYWTSRLPALGFQYWEAKSYLATVTSGEHVTALLTNPDKGPPDEWIHSTPRSDPETYRNARRAMVSYTFNRAYTVSGNGWHETFDTPDGMAMMRHYSLNENVLNPTLMDDGPTGYFAADMERAGPYCMLAEARAMANGNPRFIGYLASNCFQRGFPRYAREFNRAFLALPALQSVKLAGASSDAEVVVRRMDAGSNGLYLAVVNTGLTAKTGVEIVLPATGTVQDAATDAVLTAAGGKLTMAFHACELRALRILPDGVVLTPPPATVTTTEPTTITTTTPSSPAPAPAPAPTTAPAPVSGTLRIMPLGDSITRGTSGDDTYRKLLLEGLKSAGITADFVGTQKTAFTGTFDQDHESYHFYRAEQVLAEAQRWPTDLRPDAVLLHLGSVDILQGQSVASTLAEIGQIIDSLRLANPAVRVLIAQVVGSTWYSPAAFNSAIPDFAAQKSTSASPVTVVDQSAGFNASSDTADGFQPNAGGAKKISDKWLAALRGIYGATSATTVSGGTTATVEPAPATVAPTTTTTAPAPTTTTVTTTTTIAPDPVVATSTPAGSTTTTTATPATALRIMPLGDSITQSEAPRSSYRRYLQEQLLAAGLQVDFVGTQHSSLPGDFDQDHEGHWFWRAEQMLPYAQDWAAKSRPDAVLLLAGSVDIIQGSSVALTLERISGIVDRLRAANPAVKIYLAQPTSSTWFDIAPLNAALPALAVSKNSASSPVILVDQSSGFDPKTDTTDGFNPNESGERKIAKKWSDALRGIASAAPAPTAAPVPATTTSTASTAPATASTLSYSGAIKLMPIGDSLTQGEAPRSSYRRYLYEQLVAAGYQVDFVGSQRSSLAGTFDQDHEGHWFWRAEQILASIKDWAIQSRPDVALLMIGSVDTLQGQSIASTTEEIGKIIDGLRAGNPAVAVFLAQPPASTWFDVAPLRAALPALVAAKHSAASPVFLVDQSTGFDARTDTQDGFNLSESGERKIAQRWFEALKTNVAVTVKKSASPAADEAAAGVLLKTASGGGGGCFLSAF